MKKIFAILLALIMTASVALVSCDNADEPADDKNDFVIDFEGGDINDDTKAPETDENGETVKPSGNNDKNNPTNTNNNTTMETKNDTVYVLYNAKIREATKESAKVLVEVPFGTTLSRSEMNSKWSKVTYNGKTGYIMNDLVTTNVDTITFEDQGKAGEGEGAAKVYPTSKVKGTGNVRVRYFPLADGYPHTLVLLSANDLGEVGQVKGGDEVTILEISKDKMWAKISSTKVDKPVNGEYTKNYTSTAEGYVPYSFLEAGAGSNSGSNDGPGSVG